MINPAEIPVVSAAEPPQEVGADSDPTGLPWPHSWNGVYALVIASFVTWVLLLVAFELIYS